MTPWLVALMIQAAGSTPPTAAPAVHPWIPCWTGEGAGTTVFSTDEDEQPVRIVHNRDSIVQGNEVVQDYNFLDYEFENVGRRLVARTYLFDPLVVYVRTGGETQPQDAAVARPMISDQVLCYLQKRFGEIQVMTTEGYVRISPPPE